MDQYANVMPAERAPLVVDLDGTLTPSDTLIESLIRLIKRNPLLLLMIPVWLLGGRAGFKAAVADRIHLSADCLPYREDLVAYLVSEKAAGRRIILATAAHSRIAHEVAKKFDCFDQVLCSDQGHNLKGEAKLEAITREVGQRFSYAGDSAADLPVWAKAESVILVGVSRSVAAKVSTPVEKQFYNERADLRTWLRAMRIHQWLKNSLLFVPLLTAFSFSDLHKVALLGLAFLAFSLAASATYIANDLWDLDNDRQHVRKRLRPFASARIPIQHGAAMAALLLGTGILLASLVSPAFLVYTLIYIAMTTSYSFVLKSYVLIDVLMLSLLYTLRILAGAAAVGITTSAWLLAFSAFIFFSLALVKRCSELITLRDAGKSFTNGRDYRVGDLTVLWPLGVGASMSALVVFGLFATAPDTLARYAQPQLLWIAAVGLCYWISRLWVKTARGEMHDDPVVYAIVDRGSRLTVLAILVTIIVARFAAPGFVL